MSALCNYCTNKSQCAECDKGWHDKFIPSDDVKQYFTRGYVGVRGIDGRVYSWNSTNPNLVPTTNIDVDGYDYHCPYCGEKMFPIQGYLAQGINNYTTTGHCCICQGARDELEYKCKLKELQAKHDSELYDLKNQYRDKLKYCAEKLIDIRISHIQQKFKNNSYSFSYFSTLNGEQYHSVEQLMDL